MTRIRVFAAFLTISVITTLAAPGEKTTRDGSQPEIYCEWINSQWVCWEF